MPNGRPLILVIDDDPALLKLMRRSLELDGYDVSTAADGKTGLQLIEDEEPALVLLDIMMPDVDGFRVCERVRSFLNVPIIMLTAKGRLEDMVHGFDVGADDYVTKPFSTDELLARVKTVLRRTTFPKRMPGPPFTSNGLRIDFANRQVTINGKEVILTPTEYRVLCPLALNAGRVITHDQLLTEVWGEEYRGNTYILKTFVSRLRKKIKDDPSNPKYIVTRPGIGYIFKKPIPEAICDRTNSYYGER